MTLFDEDNEELAWRVLHAHHLAQQQSLPSIQQHTEFRVLKILILQQ
jgi:hypothetical protein